MAVTARGQVAPGQCRSTTVSSRGQAQETDQGRSDEAPQTSQDDCQMETASKSTLCSFGARDARPGPGNAQTCSILKHKSEGNHFLEVARLNDTPVTVGPARRI